jgi:photosystem II stability/assembly factor-like uncharacterized protein
MTITVQESHMSTVQPLGPNDHVFLATPGRGITRAHNVNGEWLVKHLLADHAVLCLAADPSDPGVVYAGTRAKGVLRSADRGQSWQPAGLAGQTVKALTISRAARGVVYAGTLPPMVFVSRAGGLNWSEFTAFRRIPSRRWWRSPAEASLTACVQSIALSPVDAQVIVAGIEAGAVVRSADGGESWSDHRPGALRDCHTLIAHPALDGWMYEAGGTGAGAAFSHDGGQRWTQPRAGLDRHYGWACAADAGRPDVWYVSASPMFAWPNLFVPAAHVDGKANAYIFRSEGGAAWQKLGGGLPQPLAYMAYALLTDPAGPGHLYAGLANGDVWHSQDFGDRWQRLPFNLGAVQRALIIC